jgi:hypothetical protein
MGPLLNDRNTIWEEGASRYLFAARGAAFGTAAALREDKRHRQYRRSREEETNARLEFWNSGGIKGGEMPPPVQTL